MPVYIKFEGGKTKIRGDVKKGAHKDWLTLQSVQFGATRRFSQHGGSVERENTSLSEVVCTALMTDGANDIFSASAQGTEFTQVTIDFCKTDEDAPYLQLKLKGVLVSSFQMSSSGDRPSVSFALNFKSIEHKVTPAEGKSATLMQFDLDTAKVP